MGSEIWFPGMPAGPQGALVEGLHRAIERFAEDSGCELCSVEVVLADGSRLPLDAIDAEPGFGFVTLVPHPQIDEVLPERVIVPVAAIRRIELDRAEESRGRFGFTLPSQ